MNSRLEPIASYMALFLKLEQSSHFNACVCMRVRVPSIAAFLASSSAFPSQSFPLSLSLFLFSINSQIDCMEIIRRTRYRRLQGFFLQVEGKLGPLTPREREITQRECNVAERSTIEIATNPCKSLLVHLWQSFQLEKKHFFGVVLLFPCFPSLILKDRLYSSFLSSFLFFSLLSYKRCIDIQLVRSSW